MQPSDTSIVSEAITFALDSDCLPCLLALRVKRCGICRKKFFPQCFTVLPRENSPDGKPHYLTTGVCHSCTQEAPADPEESPSEQLPEFLRYQKPTPKLTHLPYND